MLSRLRHCLPHLVMLAVSIALYWAAMQIDTAGSQGGRRIGPDFWPKAVIAFMGILCLYEVVKRAIVGTGHDAAGLAEGFAHNPAGDETLNDTPEPPAREYPGLLVAGSALIVGYVVVVPYLGFFLTTALFLGSFAWIGGFRRPLWNPLISLLGALLMVVIFMRVAYISLPLGEGPFQTLSIALLRLIGVN